jgi:hypothetical protein
MKSAFALRALTSEKRLPPLGMPCCKDIQLGRFRFLECLCCAAVAGLDLRKTASTLFFWRKLNLDEAFLEALKKLSLASKACLGIHFRPLEPGCGPSAVFHSPCFPP